MKYDDDVGLFLVLLAPSSSSTAAPSPWWPSVAFVARRLERAGEVKKGRLVLSWRSQPHAAHPLQ